MKTVRLKTFPNQFEANVVKGLLESEGIPCILHGAASNQVLPPIMVPVELLVPESDYRRACEIARVDTDPAPATTGSCKFLLRAAALFLAFFLVLFLAFFLAFFLNDVI